MINNIQIPDRLVVTIDGPAGAGKSTLAKLLAKKIDALFLDTGAMYRCVTAKALAVGIDVKKDESAVVKIAEAIDIGFEAVEGGQSVFVDGADYTKVIREPRVNDNVSHVAAIREVREKMTRLQREIGLEGRVVVEGRDTGSVVFPGADYKFFLTANADVRAGRRVLEYEAGGGKVGLKEVSDNIMERDRLDSSRKVAPLVKPDGAFEIDASNLTIDEVLTKMVNKLSC